MGGLGIKDPPETKEVAQHDEEVKEWFQRTIRRDSSGRYEVSLPWKEGHPELPDNLQVSEKRLQRTVNKLRSAGHLEDYQGIFQDWVAQEIIEEVPLSELTSFGHYLPHRAVLKEASETTKMRPVFDASSRAKGTVSLNDCLEKGPNLIELIPAVLTRFRMKRIGVISDIRKAFLQIGVQEADRNFLRFLWWEDGDEKRTEVNRHRRVVFGVSSSPFLLCATLSHHLEGAPEHLKETALLLQKSLYVDNCVLSLDNSEQLHRFIRESQELLSSAKFDLRGWMYSSGTSTDATDQTSDGEQQFSDRREIQVLGLSWNLAKDCLTCDPRGLVDMNTGPVTKRYILSIAHRVFDPVGFTCPIMLHPKLLLQETWQLKVTWDEELPKELTDKFKKWRDQLALLPTVQIPRKLIATPNSTGDPTLHVFCDASKLAYATCVFLRTESCSGSIDVQLVQARARVAPLKPVTIPRVELLACCIGARLATTVKEDMQLTNVSTYYWTDSSNAISWIKRDEQWATFVGNRVKEIRTLTEPMSWQHIPGDSNPADLPSRGCSVKHLLHVKWWEGPEWLRLPEDRWPKSSAVQYDEDEINAERRKTVVSTVNHDSLDKFWMKCSSFVKVVRVLAWMFRFYSNVQTQSNVVNSTSGELTASEIEKGERTLFKLVQKESFTGADDERLQSLQVFEDKEGILRTKTRLLLRQEDNEDFKCPIILPNNHYVVTLLIAWRHRALCHAGVQIAMSDIREQYWIVKSRRTVRRVILSCGRCKRFKAKRVEVPNASLPSDRVRDACVFEITGVDLAGPLFLRGNTKAWIVLFTCAVFRAVHLELTTSLSTEAFLQALRRFIARRGRPSVIYSDNGTNFVGANNAFGTLNWDVIQTQASVQRTKWKFNPPSAPWWGGWWEKLIGLVKQLLRRVLGRASLTYEELTTVLCDCEGVLNSRPLTYLSEDPEELSPITPAMFLQEVKTSGVPDIDTIDQESLNKRLRYRQKLRQNLRKRFRSEYLGQLKQYSRVLPSREITAGDVLLVGSDDVKRLDWPLARVLEVYPGKDGHVRVVRLKTKNGELVRPVQRLFPLEVNDNMTALLKDKLCAAKSSNRELKSTSKEPAEKRDYITRSGRRVKPPVRFQNM